MGKAGKALDTARAEKPGGGGSSSTSKVRGDKVCGVGGGEGRITWIHQDAWQF